MSSTIQIRVDDDLKTKADELFRELGTDTTSAIRIFLAQAVASNGFPFEIKRVPRNPYVKRVPRNPYVGLGEEELMHKLETARSHAGQGMLLSADDMIDELRGKYGL